MKRAAVTTFVAFLVFAPIAALAHPGHAGAQCTALSILSPASIMFWL